MIPEVSHWPELWHEVDEEDDQVYPRTVWLVFGGQWQALSQPPDGDIKNKDSRPRSSLAPNVNGFRQKCHTFLCEPSVYVICKVKLTRYMPSVNMIQWASTFTYTLTITDFSFTITPANFCWKSSSFSTSYKQHKHQQNSSSIASSPLHWLKVSCVKLTRTLAAFMSGNLLRGLSTDMIFNRWNARL